MLTRMERESDTGRDLVLLGGGHAHVEVLRRLALRPVGGLRVTVIARERMTPYTGMLPALLRGEVAWRDAHIDLAELAARAGARLVIAEARSIDLASKRVAARGQPAIGFDLLSLDIGGEPAMPAEGEVPDGVPVRPLGRLLARLDALATSLPEGARVAIIGGGAGGCELALALARCFAGRWRLTLIGDGADPVPEAPVGARRIVRGALAEAGVELVNAVRVRGVAGRTLVLSDETMLPADATLWTTGVRGAAFLARSGLDCDAVGCVRIDRSLRSISHPFVYAAGDCAAPVWRRLPKAGVYAVRAGPVLADNLRRAAEGRQPLRWRPQRAALVIVGLGGGQSVAWRGPLVASGAWVTRWKAWLDRRWMARYAPPPPAGRDAAAADGEAPPAAQKRGPLNSSTSTIRSRNSPSPLPAQPPSRGPA